MKLQIDWHIVGVSLTVVGVPYGMYLNYFFPVQQNWANIIMLISIILLANWKNLFRLKFPSYTRVLGIVMLFQIIMLTYSFFSTNIASHFLFYHMYVLALCLAYSSLSKNTSNIESLPGYLYFMSLPCLVLGWLCYVIWGLMNEHVIWEMKQAGEVFVLEAFTIAWGTLICMFAAICTPKSKMWQKIIFFIVMVVGLYTLLITTKRTPVFVLIIGLATFLYCKRIFSSQIKRQYVMGVICVIVLILLIFVENDQVRKIINQFSSNFFRGVLNLFGDTSAFDDTGSAYLRVESREWAFQYIEEHFSLVNYVFGGGYMTKWIDNPILQAYLDMGIIGFFFYGYLILVYPISIIRKRLVNDMLILAVLLSIYAIVSILNSGNPYQYLKYTPICLLAFVYSKISQKFV